VPVRLQLIYPNGFTGGYPVGNAGLWVLGRNDNDIAQAANAPNQCLKTGGIDTIVIGDHNFQSVFQASLPDHKQRADLKPKVRPYPHASDPVNMVVFKKAMQPSHHAHVADCQKFVFIIISECYGATVDFLAT
jgi:hypothetical protein